MKNASVRPFKEEDREDLKRWKKADPKILLETPHGFMGSHVETAVVEEKGEKIASLTATVVVVLDPLIKNPAANRLAVLAALFKLEAALSFVAAKTGAQDLYISVPDDQVQYHNILQRVGYTPILQGCVVFKKPLVPPIPEPQAPAVSLNEESAPQEPATEAES